MELAEGKIVRTGHNQYAVVHGEDSNNYVEFEQVAVQNQKKTEQMGCPQFDDEVFIKIMFPGDRTKVVFKKANDEYKRRYPNQWAAYLAQEKQVPEGFPIQEWPILTKAEAANFKAMNIHTVEALAGLPDTALSFFGARSYRDKAQATLAKAKDGSAVLVIEAENKALKADMEVLREQMKELLTQKKKETK